ncbi:MAG: trehalose-phosphatase [Polyangiaceae bacterium]|nr:trehalose-phosphatase [Polyangiaceae bacterium]
MSEHFDQLLRHSPLGILCDFDGTLIPFAATPEEAVPTDPLRELVGRVSSLPNVTFVIVSGRTRDFLERNFPGISLVAEHGAFRRGQGAWEPLRDELIELAALHGRVEELIARYPNARLEQKSTGLVLHYRQLSPSEREGFVVEASSLLDSFAEKIPTFQRSESTLAFEVRPSYIRKSTAVPWVRERAGHGARLLAIGDDLTDEHMFGALEVGDEAVVVRHGDRRRTKARFEFSSPEQVVTFLREIYELRIGERARVSTLPAPVERPRNIRESVSQSLLVVSNRLPSMRSAEEGKPARVGGLVSALGPALSTRDGVWLGWNGKTIDDTEESVAVLENDFSPGLLGMDLKERWYRDYYNGFCNRVLWPLFHCFPGRVRFARKEWDAYEEVHRVFADVAVKAVDGRGTVWVHDYHLLLLAREMRARGHSGPIGHFLHIPFPPPDLFEMLPWHKEILDALLSFDLLGFHTPGFMRNFLACVGTLHPARVSDDGIEYQDRRTRTGVFPIGIFPGDYQKGETKDFQEEIDGLLRILGPARLVLGVDRLDYTKGIPERLLAFGRLLELYPEFRTKVSLVQISVPSRADVPHYAEQRQQVEEIVGRINGQYGEGHWVPVQYSYRGYQQAHLARLYRAAAVGYVTPLRDGMNLVAKEYVAAQPAEGPGVLLLSRFAGAAVELRDALLTNPYDIDGMAEDLRRALTMPLDERKDRQRKLLARVESSTAATWGEAFLSALEACR